MIIPPKLVNLYCHWSKHADISNKIHGQINKNINRSVFEKMEFIVNERMQIWHQKESGRVPPYSSDPIFNKFRFCNVYRELDRQTVEIHSKYFPLLNHFSLWLLNVAFARFICRPQTLNQLNLLSLSPSENKKLKTNLLHLPSPKYGTAYVFPVSILKKINCPNRETFLSDYLPSVIEKVANLITNFSDESISHILPLVTQAFGLPLRFHLTEILIDVAYQYPHFLNLYKKFPIGPGSLPTMKSLSPNLDPEAVCLSLVTQKYNQANLLVFNHQPLLLSAENWEGVGCEYRKYTNLLNGLGRHRLYKTNAY